MSKPTTAMDCDKHWILFFNTKNGAANDCPYCKLETELLGKLEAAEAENKALREQVAAMVDGLELQNNAVNGTPADLKATCQIITLAAKKIEGKIKT